jgi:hypothetical protein
MTDTPLLALALRLLDREERLRPDAGWHPSPEELTAYRDGRLSARRASRVCRHLGVCFDCPDLLLELECFLEPLPEETGTGTAADTSAFWQELRRRLFAEPRARPPAWRVPSVFASLGAAYALAAASLLAAVALSLWSLSPQPVANMLTANVDMPGLRRGPEPLQEVRVPAEGVLLILNLAGLQDGSDLRLEILDPSGRRLGSVDRLRSESGSVQAFLPRRFLPPGEIRLRMTGRGLSATAEEVILRVLHL